MPAAEHRSLRDLALVAAATLASYLLASHYELHERYFGWLARYERWQADEIPLSLLVLACGLAWYAFRRWHEARAALRLHEQARAEATELLAHNRELARGLIALQESERAALARELHDEIGQRCTALRIETALLRHCAEGDRAGMLAAAARAEAEAGALYQLARGLLRRLRPAQLDELGLVAALQELCDAWSARSGVACSFRHDGPDAPLPDAVAIAAYRIAQEALTNTMRHARAGRVELRLARDDAGLSLDIADDGCGMEPVAASRGLGLLGAHERAAALGGTLQVEAAPGRGVRLQLRLPLHETAPLAEAAR